MNSGTKKDPKNDKSLIEKFASPLRFEIKRKSDNADKFKRTAQNTKLISTIMAERRKEADDVKKVTPHFMADFKLDPKDVSSNSDDDTFIKMVNEFKPEQNSKNDPNLQKTTNERSRSKIEIKKPASIDPKLETQKTLGEKNNSKTTFNDSKLKTINTPQNVFKNAMIFNDNNYNSAVRRIGESDYSSNTFSEVLSFNDFSSRKKSTVIKLMNPQFDGEEDFFEGTIVKGKKSGFCRILYSSGLYKEANFVNGSLEGEGSFRFSNGITVSGIFNNNQLYSHIYLSIDGANYPLDFMEGKYHSDQIYLSDKNVFFVPYKICEKFSDYTGRMRVYFRNGYKLEVLFEKGLALENSECILTDKFDNAIKGKIKHGLHVEKNGMFIFRPFNDLENEYMLLFKGEGSIVRKHKK